MIQQTPDQKADKHMTTLPSNWNNSILIIQDTAHKTRRGNVIRRFYED